MAIVRFRSLCFIAVVSGVVILCYHMFFQESTEKLRQTSNTVRRVQRTPEGILSKKAEKLLGNGSLVSLDVRDGISGKDLEGLFSLLAQSVEVGCEKSTKVIIKGGDGWSVCLDDTFMLESPCLVYSFGINNDWSFEDEIANKYGCFIRSFDPNMTRDNHRRGTNIIFYKEGLAGIDVITDDKLWRLNTLGTFRKSFKEENATIDYLKLDVMYREWESLYTAIKDGSLQDVKQLAVEIHTDEFFSTTSSIKSYVKFLDIFRRLRKMGFYKWYTRVNPGGVSVLSDHSGRKVLCCYQFVFINLHYI